MDKRKGFTLIELVVVVMILGILAAVAAPKLLSTSATATDNGARQTLAVVRDAIERYAAEHGGELPADPATDLANYLRGPFPTCPVGDADDLSAIEIVADDPIGGADADPDSGWKYSTATGEFIINSSSASASDPNISYDEF